MSKLYGIYGVGGFSREVMPILVSMKGISRDNVCFVTDKEFIDNSKLMNNYPVLSYEDFKASSVDEKYITVAVSNKELRRKIYDKCTIDKIKHYTLISNKSCIMNNVIIGEGSIISPFATLTSNINIGKSFHANLYSYVAHDCNIGNYVTFAPSVKCNGNVIIEDNVYVGTGAIIKQGTNDSPIIIGENATIGAGAFVTKNVVKNTTVFGNPAKLLNKKNIER
tara:strand:- start:519 stop:1187 length:669 start_codon:yes stop_codon:yes gene_type:complete